jgi:EmrB/QacA subfamily drug resistance transporter
MSDVTAAVGPTSGLQSREGVGTRAGVGPRAWAALAVLCLGAFVVVLDTTIVNIAIPSLMTGLHAGLDQVLWVLNAYTLVYAALLITGGRFGDLFGPRRLFLAGITVFVLASIGCSAAQSVPQLVVARVAQGVGGALLTPQTLALIPVIFPERRRGAAIGLWSASAGLAAAVGPTIGGLLVTSAGWRSIFWVNVPLGVVSIAGALLLLPSLKPGRKHHIDVGGIVLAGAGLFALVFALLEGQHYSWGRVVGPVTIPTLLVTGFGLLAAFLLWERRQAEPLMPLPLFSSRNFSVSAWVIVAFQVVVLSFIVSIGLFFQTVLHMSALDAGLSMAPTPLAIVVFSALAGRLSDRVHPKHLLMVGLFVAAAGLTWLVAVMSAHASEAALVAPMVVIGAGLGSAFAVVMTMGMRGVPAQYVGAASGILNTFRQGGAAMGAAITAAILQSQLATGVHAHAVAAGSATYASGFVSALRPTLSVPVAVLLLAGVSCLLIRRGPAATLATAVPSTAVEQVAVRAGALAGAAAAAAPAVAD